MAATTFTDAMKDTSSFLDSMLKEEGATPPSSTEVPPVENPEPEEVIPVTDPAPVTPIVETPPVVDPVTPVVVDPAPVTPVVETPPAVVDPPPEVKPDVDPYPEFKLSPHARPATAEQFTKLKARAQQDIATRESELATLRQKISELESRPAPPEPLTDDVKAELNTLRAFRESIAIEGDPIFEAKYGTPIQKLDETVLGKLKEAGFTDENLTKVKEIGVDKLDWTQVLNSVPALKPFIDRKLLERDGLVERKVEAIKAARTNYDSAVAERREAATVREQQDLQTATGDYERFLTGVPQLKTQIIPADATPEKKAELQNANRAIASAIDLGKKLVAISNTPAGRAETATVAALAHVFKQQAQGAMSAYSSEKAAHDVAKTELGSVKSELTKVKDELSKLRSSGRTVTTSTPRATSGVKPGLRPGATASEALDYYAAQEA
jgi:hypothetical protein